MTSGGLFTEIHARLHSDERGFTMVEAMVAGMILAIGAFAVAQSLQFGLKTTGLARQRAAAQALANQAMEQARALNYSNVALRNSQAGDLPSHSTNPNNPDYWVTGSGTDADPLMYDPDGSGSIPPEPIYSIPTSPSLIHHQTNVQNGSSTFTIDRYVTWVDSPIDGCAAITTTCTGPLGDQNRTGQPGDLACNLPGDPCGHDMKRVTVVVTWNHSYGTGVSQLKISSLFSPPSIPYQGTAPVGSHANNPPTVDCPIRSSIGKTAYLTAQASDSDGSIAQIDWDFGDGVRVQNGGWNQTHTYSQNGTYTITNTVWDNVGASANNSSLVCTIEIKSNTSGGADITPPTGAAVCGRTGIAIACDATYTNNVQVTLNLYATDTGGSGLSRMQFSDGNVGADGQMQFGALIAYGDPCCPTSTLYTLPEGDGVKTVYVRFVDGANNISVAYSDTILLDTTPPGQVVGLTATRGSVSHGKVDITVSWSAPFPLPSDMQGYRVYRLIGTAGSTFTQVGGDIATNKFSYVDKNLDSSLSYTYCVVAFDMAGNQLGATQRACVGPM